jgi:hypothetical protein
MFQIISRNIALCQSKQSKKIASVTEQWQFCVKKGHISNPWWCKWLCDRKMTILRKKRDMEYPNFNFMSSSVYKSGLLYLHVYKLKVSKVATSAVWGVFGRSSHGREWGCSGLLWLDNACLYVRNFHRLQLLLQFLKVIKIYN